jgi:hypothetical protein
MKRLTLLCISVTGAVCLAGLAACASKLCICSVYLPDGEVNIPYSQSLEATGGSGIYTWSVVYGTLPAGLSLDPATGVISGTPTTSGTSSLIFQITDSKGASLSQGLSLTIETGPGIFTSSLPDGQVNSAYSQVLEAIYGSGIYTGWSITSGILPGGLSLGSSDGIISRHVQLHRPGNRQQRC